MKAKICNCGCGTEFIPTKLGQKQVNKSHYITWLIHTPQGQKKQAEAREKAKKIIVKKEEKNKSAIEWQEKANKNWAKFKREQKKETRSYQQELILTKKPIQKWCVLRDKYSNNKILGIIKFNLYKKYWNKPIAALGGVNSQNYRKVSMSKSCAVGFINWMRTIKKSPPTFFLE